MYRLSKTFFKHILERKSFPTVKGLAILDAHDVHPFKVLFPNTQELLFYNCDKNTHYYWANSHAFPKVKTLWLGGHPCEPDLVSSCLDRLQTESLKQLIIPDSEWGNWMRYGAKWYTDIEKWKRNESLIITSYDTFKKRIDHFPEELSLTNDTGEKTWENMDICWHTSAPTFPCV
jgi:hypothetical protein